MRLKLSTWTLPIPLLAACMLINCGLRQNASLGDDSAPLQQSDDDDEMPSVEPTPCGDAVCGAGEYCCNASCGTCAEEGQGCTLQDCEPSAYQPCAGKTCGAECTLCAPGDADCAEDAVIKYCAPDGTCSPTAPECEGDEQPYAPCEGKSCGDACTLCAPENPNCVETADRKACDATGTCRSGIPVCAAECEPGTTKMLDCNSCDCVEDRWVCTDAACDEGVVCWGLDSCPEGQYCAYVAGQYCGASDATATCLARPEACDLLYAPVCGCDRVTYDNACVAAAAGSGVYSEGECER
jgi:hypothetical protein